MAMENPLQTATLSWKLILSVIVLVIGVVFWLYWGLTYNVWTDIGIYSVTIFFVLSGVFGLLLSLMESNKQSQEL